MSLLNKKLLDRLEQEQELTRILALVKNVAIVEYDSTNIQVSLVFHQYLRNNNINASIVRRIILFAQKDNNSTNINTLKSLFPAATIECFDLEWQDIEPKLLNLHETLIIHACISENLNFNKLKPTSDNLNEQKLNENRKFFENSLIELGLFGKLSNDSTFERFSTFQSLIDLWKATRHAYQVCVLFDYKDDEDDEDDVVRKICYVKCDLRLNRFFTHVEANKPKPTQYCLDKQNYIKIYGEKLTDKDIFFQCFEETQQGCEECNQCENYGKNKKCPFAQRKIAQFFRDGFFVPQNNEIAHQWELMAARQRYKPALVQVADDLATGTGCKQNPVEAVSIYDEFARQNDDYCLHQVIAAIDNSDSIAPSRAVPYLAMLAQNGDDDMTLRLAKAFQNGDLGLPKDRNQQEALIRQGAENGKPHFILAMARMFEAYEIWNDAYQWYKELEDVAPELLPEGKLEEIEIKIMTNGASDKKIAQLGIDYLYGYNGMNRNPHFAYRCFLMAYKNGVTLAEGMLGQMYFKGIEVEANVDKGLEMLNSAASKGDLLSIEKLIEIKDDTSNNYNIKDVWSKNIVEWINEGIEHKDPVAFFLKGKFILEGRIFKSDVNHAFQAIFQAADLNYPRALYQLAMFYKDGIGTINSSTYNYEKYIERAARAGHYEAMGIYGPILYRQYDWDEAFKMLSGAYEQGFYSTEAIYFLAQCYMHAHGTPSDKPKAYELLKQAAQDGHLQAQVRLCEDYFRGNEYLEINYEQCRRWGEAALRQGEKDIKFETAFSSMQCGFRERGMELYLELANEGNSSAMNNYGCNLNDPVEKFQWFEKAANAGNSYAFWNMGNAYIDGNGVEKDFDKGLSLIKKGAQNGCVGAAEQLARMYKNGEDVDIDGKEAVKWYEKAIELDSKSALFELASLYYDGEIVPVDFKKALHYYKLSSEKGNVQAFVMQGVFYINGFGVDVDVSKAIYWYRKAAVAGNSFAKKELKKLNVNWEKDDNSNDDEFTIDIDKTN